MIRLNVLIPMAGRGERFSAKGFETPKPLIEINKTPMIQWAVNSLGFDKATTNYIFVTRKYSAPEYNEKLENLLKNLVTNWTQFSVDYVTEGPACTCLLAEPFINNDIPLIICNCDQIMRWDGEFFINSAINSKYDGMVVTYEESTPKNSYAKLNSHGHVIQVAEKQVISNVSLNGVHYWKCGKYFVDAAKEMISKDERYNNEFYVGPSYNQMIGRGLKVGIFHIPKECHIPVGVPGDLEAFLGKSE